jgi:hypothetical protein
MDFFLQLLRMNKEPPTSFSFHYFHPPQQEKDTTHKWEEGNGGQSSIQYNSFEFFVKLFLRLFDGDITEVMRGI